VAGEREAVQVEENGHWAGEVEAEVGRRGQPVVLPLDTELAALPRSWPFADEDSSIQHALVLPDELSACSLARPPPHRGNSPAPTKP
jgi:hypothetical protein